MVLLLSHSYNNNNNNRPAFIHALWIADPSKRATGRNMQPIQRRRKGDLNAVCDRQQARNDPLLFTKRPATLTQYYTNNSFLLQINLFRQVQLSQPKAPQQYLQLTSHQLQIHQQHHQLPRENAPIHSPIH